MPDEVSLPLPAQTDVLLVGAGIMSATLGMLLHLLAPGLRITVVDALASAATESSDAWNNACTGHAALCELNYTPERPDGTIAVDRAVKINEQFQQSRQFWASLVELRLLQEPQRFLNTVPHMSFVSGADATQYLRRRHAALAACPLFAGMRFTEDRGCLQEWMPLMMDSREGSTPVAATRADSGTDLDFGALSRMLFATLRGAGITVHMRQRVRSLTHLPDGRWYVELEDIEAKHRFRMTARFVFLGAGGGALPLLQRSGIPEGRGYGGFPVSGQWLRCHNPDVIEQHAAKVYGKPALGAPPMSVPHLDTRWINGKRELLFGPFAGFSTKFLKQGSYADLPRSIGPGNLVSMLGAGLHNVDLTRYLIGQVMLSQKDRVQELRSFVPSARDEDWQLEIAGQRVQIIKSDPKKGGVLEFGTEIIHSSDRSLAALLGASPGASTAVAIMLDLVARGLPVLQAEQHSPDRLRSLVPSYGRSLANDTKLLAEVTARTSSLLNIV